MKATKKPTAQAVSVVSATLAQQAAANDAKAPKAPAFKGTYPAHRVTQLFPRASAQQINELSESIRKNGQAVTIKVVRGQIIDGLARDEACRLTGVEPKFEHLDHLSEQEILNLCISLNLLRRHLTESQRAMVAASIAQYQVGANQYSEHGVTQGDAALIMGVSVDSVQRAKTVLEKGTPELLTAVNEGKFDVTNAQKIAELPQPMQLGLLKAGDKKLIVDTAKKINLERKAAKREERVRNNALLSQQSVPLAVTGTQYDCVVADPAWEYLGRHATDYPTMKLADICAMPVKQRSSANSVLFLWVPASLVQEGLQVMAAWGFEFKTTGVWKKGNSGLGGMLRVNHELLFIGTRGTPPAVASTPVSCFDAPRGKHSEKPKVVFEMVEQMYPELTKVELFCRGEPRMGWSGWGNECIGAIDMPLTGDAKPAANEPTFKDAGDELLAALGMVDENPAPVKLKRA
jgi:N6-adenosine-specific RNA methylase IME4